MEREPLVPLIRQKLTERAGQVELSQARLGSVHAYIESLKDSSRGNVDLLALYGEKSVVVAAKLKNRTNIIVDTPELPVAPEALDKPGDFDLKDPKLKFEILRKISAIRKERTEIGERIKSIQRETDEKAEELSSKAKDSFQDRLTQTRLKVDERRSSILYGQETVTDFEYFEFEDDEEIYQDAVAILKKVLKDKVNINLDQKIKKKERDKPNLPTPEVGSGESPPLEVELVEVKRLQKQGVLNIDNEDFQRIKDQIGIEISDIQPDQPRGVERFLHNLVYKPEEDLITIDDITVNVVGFQRVYLIFLLEQADQRIYEEELDHLLKEAGSSSLTPSLSQYRNLKNNKSLQRVGIYMSGIINRGHDIQVHKDYHHFQPQIKVDILKPENAGVKKNYL